MVLVPVGLELTCRCRRLYSLLICLDAYVLEDFLFLGVEDLGEVFVELRLVLLEFCSSRISARNT